MTTTSGGYGTGAYGLSPYGSFATTYADEAPHVHVSSRRIDGQTSTLVYDDDGNPRAMDDVAQRVLNVWAFRVRVPTVFGDTFDAELEAEVRSAYAPMTSGRQPVILITSIVTEQSGGTAAAVLTYQNLTTNQPASERFPIP